MTPDVTTATDHIVAAAEVGNANLFCQFEQSAAGTPDAIAVRCGDRVVSYAELERRSAQVAGMLASAGVTTGDRVAVMLPNVPEFAMAYLGALRAGAVVVPMNPMLKSREVGFYLSDPEVKVVFVAEACLPEVETGAADTGATVVVVDAAFESLLSDQQPADLVAIREPQDTAVILYTSGTTGTPKGAELTHSNLSRNAQVAIGLLGYRAGDVVIGALPLFHVFGLTCGLNGVLAQGATVALITRFDAGAVLDTIQDQAASVFLGVPTMYGALLHHPGREAFDVSTLAMCVSGGAALPIEVLRAFEAAFGCDLLEGYGLSETSPIASFNMPGNRKPGSIGTPVDGVEMKVIDKDGDEVPVGEVGEIAIRGHNVMKGYWRRPEATAEAIDAQGWFRSGDMGRLDDEGFFSIVDRKKELIIRGGYNVYPREIEEVLYEHPAVRECAVIGLPHPDLGEEVAAAVVPIDGTVLDADELRAYVKDRVAAYKYPRHVHLVESLPKGATGKILKREIVLPSAR